ncbi:conserved protein of unknown function (plasmid) [Magnetospirillum sp. XM-1]|uniref:DUF1281 family ferredoxin-like fold protein n=1 Tax=Magnetospirillum sp. XM-1 TaxID=1663591 RepID=UPI00073DC820|nr:hypothetical protein [Magnetospirillum sp. XM-1]CUW41907.1 conserved protein of unknown function [Magnetospirillum sp. XM-1]
MPNHVTTRVVLHGEPEQIAAFLHAHIREDQEGKRFLDFETVIPMPDVVRMTDATAETQLGFVTVMRDAEAAARYLEYPWIMNAGITTPEQLFEWVERTRPESIAKGIVSKQALAETGHANWMEWTNESWGTKWSSYDYSETDPAEAGPRFEFRFNTAWYFPIPIFEKLADRWPKIAFEIDCYDEGDTFEGTGWFNGSADDPPFALYDAGTNEGVQRRVYGDEVLENERNEHG